MSARTVRLLPVVLIAALVVMPATAGAGQCSADVNPDPGWVGAVITFTGTGLEPNVGYDIRIGGGPIINLSASAAGTFSYDYTIPAQWDSGESSVGVTEWYVFVQSGCKPMGETAQPYVVLASEPPTTTPPTTVATTTTVASTTTVSGDTTTTAAVATTTTAAGITTTTDAGEEATTTTVLAGSESDGGGGGVSPIVWIAIAAVVGGVGVFLGRAMGKK